MKTQAKELHEQIGKNIDGLQPWQYQKHNLISLNYDIILDDILTYWNQQARFREGFKVEGENVYVPNFFTKINGIHKKEKDYINFVKNLVEAKNTVLLDNTCELKLCDLCDINGTDITNNDDEILFTKNSFEKYWSKKYNPDGLFYYDLTIKNVLGKKILGYTITGSNFTFDLLTSHKQKQLLSIIENYVEKNKESLTNKQFIRFLNICLALPDTLITLINNFDYSFDVPKVIVTKKIISEDISTLLTILNEFAIDILILEPSGKSTIEKYQDINELSIGYFVENFDLDKCTNDVEDQLRKTFDKTKKEFIDRELVLTIPIIIGWIIMILTMYFATGGINTIVQIIMLVLAIFYTIFLDEECFNDFIIGSGVVTIIAIIVLMVGRFFYWAVTTDATPSTETYSGYQIIEEDSIYCDSGFVIKQKTDAILKDGGYTLYCYLENNAINQNEIHFKLFVGNSCIYESGNIEPLEYVKSLSLNCTLPLGSNEITVKYYLYDKEQENPFTDTLLGDSKLMVHVISSEEFSDKKEELKLNY